jgi:hypothetical protein
LLGKRYVCAHCEAQLLVVKGGEGSLECHGEPMTIEAPKALPSSDRVGPSRQPIPEEDPTRFDIVIVTRSRDHEHGQIAGAREVRGYTAGVSGDIAVADAHEHRHGDS